MVIGSQSSHRLNVDAFTQAQAEALAMLPPEELLELPLVQEVTDSLYAYQLSKRGNALRVMAEAVKWGKRGARINCISAGIVYMPLAYDELNSAERFIRICWLNPLQAAAAHLMKSVHWLSFFLGRMAPISAAAIY